MRCCRHLKLHHINECLNDDLLPESFGSLTQLVTLDIADLPTSSLAPILGLPCLEKLVLGIKEGEREPTPIPLQSESLTGLTIFGGHSLSVRYTST